MADIFNKVSKNRVDGFSLDKAKLTFSALPSTSGLLIQNVQINYQQQVSFVYDLANPADVYYVAGRTQGTMQIGKVVGSASLMKTFYQKYGDVCAVTQDILKISGVTGCSGQNQADLDIAQPVITSVGISMSVENAVVGENCQLMFASLSLN